METIKAKAYIEIFAECPYCMEDTDISRKIDVNINTSLGNNNIDKTIKCTSCNQEFKVTEITIN